MMEGKLVALICVLAAAANVASPFNVKLFHDRPGLRLAISETATMKCCYSTMNEVNIKWEQTVMNFFNTTESVTVNDKFYRVKIKNESKTKRESNYMCSILILDDIKVNDSGLYQCSLKEKNKNSNITFYTPGTFLQVYEPIKMILGISEASKNSIITAEGVFLLLFVLLPGTALICKSKGLNELEKRKGKEEENIYEGLNLDDCNSTYHQIQRSLVQGPYQDVINNDEDDIQLEKP
ncbi:B-cell antigen receptor complex-associated protein alpha chain [Clarias gariepinus]